VTAPKEICASSKAWREKPPSLTPSAHRSLLAPLRSQAGLRWVRDMHRATVSAVANTCEQASAANVTLESLVTGR